MKRFALAVLGVICIGLGLAVAQSINRSVQLTFDASGMFGVSTPGGLFVPDRIHGNSQLTPTAAQSSGTPAITGTDLAGEVIEATGATTSVSVAFTRVQNATPYCNATSNASATPVGIFATPAGFQVNHSSNNNTTGVFATQLRFYYSCFSARVQ